MHIFVFLQCYRLDCVRHGPNQQFSTFASFFKETITDVAYSIAILIERTCEQVQLMKISAMMDFIVSHNYQLGSPSRSQAKAHFL